MGKVLITSIGNRRFNTKTQQYDLTNYVIPDGSNRTYRSSYVFEAVTLLEHIDRLILIGTTGSAWKSVYEYLVTEDTPLAAAGVSMDQAYLNRLGALLSNPERMNFPLQDAEKDLEPLKGCLNPSYRPEILLMRYGVQDSDWNENLKVLGRIEDLLEDGDELYLDVTHSFRSLPIFQMLVIFYFRNISQKHIQIRKVTYGMFEVSAEYGGNTPIVDLSRLSDLMKYIQLASEYRKFGTAYGLEDLMQQGGGSIAGLSQQQLSMLADLSDMVSINDMSGFKNLVNNADQMLAATADDTSEFPLLAHTICQDIHDSFAEGISDPIMTEFNLAWWHMEKRHYQTAVTTALETCTSFAMALCGVPADTNAQTRNSYNVLNRAGGKEFKQRLDAQTRDFAVCCEEMRNVRNLMAHPTPNLEKDERRTLGRILVHYQLKAGDRPAAQHALTQYYTLNAAEQTALLDRLETAGERTRKRCMELLEDCLAEPFKAATMASRLVVYWVRKCYRTFFFGDTPEVAQRKEALAQVVRELVQKDQERYAKLTALLKEL